MKTIKRLIVLVVCFVLLSNSFSLNVSAVDVSEPDSDKVIMYGMTHSELIEYGYIFEDGCYYLPEDVISPEAFIPSFMVATEPNYSSFSPSDIPWSSAPSYVQEIFSMGLEKADTTNVSEYRMPFVAIRVTSSYIDVYVGINCFIGTTNDRLRARICANGTLISNGLYSCCYVIRYNHKMVPQYDWKQLSYSVWGDTGNIVTYNTASWFDKDDVADIYVYGGNGAKVNTSPGVIFTSVSIPSTSDTNVCCPTNNRIGFTSGSYIYSPSSYPDIYTAHFYPPTSEQLSNQLQQNQNSLIEEGNETSKSIFEKIKELPSLIADKIAEMLGRLAELISGLFTILGDRISGFFESLKNYLLYFQETKPEHINPFAGIFDGIQSFFDEQIGDTEDFKSSLNTTFDNVSGYIETGSNIVNNLLNGVPILNTVLIFFLAFAVIRKVVGR